MSCLIRSHYMYAFYLLFDVYKYDVFMYFDLCGIFVYLRLASSFWVLYALFVNSVGVRDVVSDFKCVYNGSMYVSCTTAVTTYLSTRKTD